MTSLFVEKEGHYAIRLETHDSASMLFRHVEVELDAYPFLSWDWYQRMVIATRWSTAESVSGQSG